MARTGDDQNSGSRHQGGGGCGTQAFSSASETPRIRTQFAPGANLFLQIVFPPGYPIGPARSRVLYEFGSNRTDQQEEGRIARLAEESGSTDGFVQSEIGLTLSVTDPKLDRLYVIEWKLPGRMQRVRWLMNRYLRAKSDLVPRK